MIPVERLTQDFFRLKTGVAGEIIQKSLTALRGFVYECNGGTHVWFVGELAELHQRLQPPSVRRFTTKQE